MRPCPGEPLCDPSVMTPPLAAAPQRRAYDHRLREQVCRTGSHALSRRLEIPRSTIATWKRRGLRPVVSVEMFGADRHQLLRTIEKLEKRAQILAATIRLLLALMRASGFRLAHQRLPEGAVKASILRAITSATNALPLAVILRILGLPVSRYHAWAASRHRPRPRRPFFLSTHTGLVHRRRAQLPDAPCRVPGPDA